MTEASRNVFKDRRTFDEQTNGLATQILFWYSQDKKKRPRTNGIAVTMEGDLVVARATCSRDDQFVRAMGRIKVSSRIMGRAKKHFWILSVTNDSPTPKDFADAYLAMFPKDEMGSKRAFNVGKIFMKYREDLTRRAEVTVLNA
jgi:hypothetical protein